MIFVNSCYQAILCGTMTTTTHKFPVHIVHMRHERPVLRALFKQHPEVFPPGAWSTQVDDVMVVCVCCHTWSVLRSLCDQCVRYGVDEGSWGGKMTQTGCKISHTRSRYSDIILIKHESCLSMCPRFAKPPKVPASWN